MNQARKIIERTYPVGGQRWRFLFTIDTLEETKMRVLHFWERGWLDYCEAEAICDSLDRAARAAAA